MTYLRELNLVSIALRIMLALVTGGMLGIGRERKNRPAGFRTYMLVCLGAALVMMTNQYAHQVLGVSDPVRMGAQVVSGIGFLGAGTMILTGRNQVRGVTTAAGLWTAACSGLAIGIGFYEGAIMGGIVVFLIMSAMMRLDRRIHTRSRYMDLYVELEGTLPLSHFIRFVQSRGFDISDIQIKNNELNQSRAAMLTIISKEPQDHVEVVELLGGAEGVTYLVELRD